MIVGLNAMAMVAFTGEIEWINLRPHDSNSISELIAYSVGFVFLHVCIELEYS